MHEGVSRGVLHHGPVKHWQRPAMRSERRSFEGSLHLYGWESRLHLNSLIAGARTKRVAVPAHSVPGVRFPLH